MNDLVTIEKRDGIADVRLNRPHKHNSLNMEMFEAIVAAGQSLLDDEEISAVVLSGNGASFCSGLDFEAMQALIGGDERARRRVGALFGRGDGPANFAQRTAYVWTEIPVPVIAVIRGVAYGGGCQIALAADIRIAEPNAKMSIMEINYGLIPDMAITQTLPDLVRLDVAMELILTGRVLDAAQAKDYGLVTKIADDPLAAAFALAHEIADKSPDAIRACKRLLRDAWRAEVSSGLELEETLQRSLIGTRNQTEAVHARLQRRTPEFHPPAKH